MRLGVNVDHVATLRQARKTHYPDPAIGALMAEYAGAHSVVVHLREDRRHIQERDVILIQRSIKIDLNLEMSINTSIVSFACKHRPHQATLVPERRQELTTEGGIDLSSGYIRIKKVVEKLKSHNITVSLFIDPLKRQVTLAKKLGADMIEFNTGKYAESRTRTQQKTALTKIRSACEHASRCGLSIAAGHGLHYDNVKPILQIRRIKELNIGHAIIARSLFVGLVPAVEEMCVLINQK